MRRELAGGMAQSQDQKTSTMTDSDTLRLPVLTSFWSALIDLITMADQPSSTAAKKSKKKGGSRVKLFRDLIKRPISANDSASQSNSTWVSVSSAFGAHDPVPGNDAGNAEPTASTFSSKYILFPSQCYRRRLGLPPDDNVTLNQGMYHPEFIPRRSSGLSS